MASGRETPKRGALVEAEFTSREAARISGVPFFTLDYWDRSAFLKPSIARSTGRGRGHGRLYSYGDLLRLRIARELRDQHVSLQTLRFVVRRLGDRSRDLAIARYVHPDEFAELEQFARDAGITHVVAGPLVRSSYHADGQAALVRSLRRK